MELSSQGQKLISFYEEMLKNNMRVKTIYGDIKKGKQIFEQFQAQRFKSFLLPIFKENKIKTLLDYGSGGSDWDWDGFDKESNLSAKKFFGLDKVFKYEPARNLNEKKRADCVLCFDVLEHVYILDIHKIIEEIFSYSKKIVIINVACYSAGKLLPNNENVHVTVRPDDWWKSIFDNISIKFPNIKVVLICSQSLTKVTAFKPWKADDWFNSKTFEVKYC